MREIKFRVWSNPNKRYVQDEDDYYVRSDGQFVEISLGDMFNELNTDRFIFEQYTGLKDKNGKEIYEGDIVKCLDCNEEDYYITDIDYDDDGGAFIVEVSGCDYDYTALGWALDNGDIREVEVIGNIHQNPELLNEK